MLLNLGILFLFRWSFVLSETMEWGLNPNMVDEENAIQGREHIKALVVMVGESTELVCQVGFTSQPVSKILWKLDGRPKYKTENQTEDSKKGDVFVEDSMRIDITEEMDGSTVSCEYSRGQYGGSVEVIIRVYKLQINLTQEACDTRNGNAKLLFEKSKKNSPADKNVRDKIVSKIAEFTKLSLNEILVSKSEYSVNMDVASVFNSEVISSMAPTLIISGKIVPVGLEQCTTSSASTTSKNKSINQSTTKSENKTPAFGIIGLIALSVAAFLMILFVMKKIMTKTCEYCTYTSWIQKKMNEHIKEFKMTHTSANYIADVEKEKIKSEKEELRNMGLSLKEDQYKLLVS